MKTLIVGDSYARTFYGTWIEKVFNELNFQLVHHQGLDGGCQFQIYENFKRVVDFLDLDLAIIVHTEPGRLPNPLNYGITPKLVTDVPVERTNLPEEVYYAARAYYENLYYEPFQKWVHKNLIKDIQEICLTKNIRQIHIPSFLYHGTPMNHGLWVTGGIYELTKFEGDYIPGTIDKRKNHLSEDLHNKFSKWLIPHLRYYLDEKGSQDLHVVMLDPHEVNRCS